MPALPEVEVWETEVTELALSDRLKGGVAGELNRSTMQLANRTAYLRRHLLVTEGAALQFGHDESTSIGLTYGYRGGYAFGTSDVMVNAPAGTVLLTNAAVNYVERTLMGVVSANTDGFSRSRFPMARVTTAAGAITLVEDWRALAPGQGYFPLVQGETQVVDFRYLPGHIKRYGAKANGVFDDAPAINYAIGNARAGRCDRVILPAGPILARSQTIDLTLLGESAVIVEGAGASVSAGGTVIFGQQGDGKAAIDLTGSSYYTLRGFVLYCSAGWETSIGILQARSAAPGALVGERWRIERVHVVMESRPAANGGEGTVGIYNCNGEDGVYDAVWSYADAPWHVTFSNVLGVVSPVLGALTPNVSMTSVQARSCLASAFLRSAVQFDGAGSMNWDVVTVPIDSNPSYAFGFRGACSDIEIRGQDDQSTAGWAGVAHFRDSAEFVRIRRTISGPAVGGGLIKLDAGIELAGLTVQIKQLNGAVQELFDASAGASTISAADVTLLPGQRIDDANLKLHGLVRTRGAAAPTTVAMGSNYVELSESGIRLSGAVATRRIVTAWTVAWTIDARTGGHQELDASVPATAFAVNAPLNLINGDEVEITISNSSAGALGAVTWDPIFKLAALAMPAAGFSRSVRFRYNGVALVEKSRTPADVPN